jgi:hypothetical protein
MKTGGLVGLKKFPEQMLRKEQMIANVVVIFAVIFFIMLRERSDTGKNDF